jgi:hypothetical protein
MSIGISAGDFVIAINLARETCSNCLKAPKEFHEAGRAADGLSVVLEALEDERKDPRSPLRRSKRRARHLRSITVSLISITIENAYLATELIAFWFYLSSSRNERRYR